MVGESIKFIFLPVKRAVWAARSLMETKSIMNYELLLMAVFSWAKVASTPSITDGVHRNENLVEIIPVFSTFSNFFKKKKKIIKAILCNFSMRLLKYF